MKKSFLTLLMAGKTAFIMIPVLVSVLLLAGSLGCSSKTNPVKHAVEPEQPKDTCSQVLTYHFSTGDGAIQFPVEYRISHEGKAYLFKAAFLMSLIEKKESVIHPDSIEFVHSFAPFFDPDGDLVITDSESIHFLKRIQVKYSHINETEIPMSSGHLVIKGYVLRNEQ